jgi:ribonuclease Z
MNPFRYLTPYFFSGLMDDPILLIRIKPLKESLLFDCGNINHIAKRIFKSINTVFISHAHMDHFIGIDTLIRNILVSPKTIKIFGPPDIAKKIEAKLSGYDWNLVEDYYCNLEIHEISENNRKIYTLQGREGFRILEQRSETIKSNQIYENRFLIVEADLCDHKIPVLIFKVTEKPRFEIDQTKLKLLEIETGNWLNHLKHWFYHQDSYQKASNDLQLLPLTPAVLYEKIKKESAPVSLGYVTDIGFHEDNIKKIEDLLVDVNLLICECSFLNQDRHKARNSFHLCTSDVNSLIEMLNPKIIVPMHLSKTYKKISQQLYNEIKTNKNCKMVKLPIRKTLLPLKLESGRLF